MLENVGKLKQNCGDTGANSDDVVLQYKTLLTDLTTLWNTAFLHL